ncbi:MAG: AAA family ATPase [Candidatus Magnetomorum sp.]|nr:AAA family ATPase [Candidatus Magnetomorum sp.]
MANIIKTIVSVVKHFVGTGYTHLSKTDRTIDALKTEKTILAGHQYFPNFIETNAVYIDKTKYIFKLLESNTNQCFLSRPRRFGKSLLISTMKELFLGNKQLFKGLYVYDTYDFTPYPIIHIDFSKLRYSKNSTLEDTLNIELNEIADTYNVTLKYGIFLHDLIKALYEKFNRKVVILVDEYDKPIVGHLKNTDEDKQKRNENRDYLKSFFGPLKGLEEMIHFIFITGVSKFSKVSIFSELNNLTDLTFNSEYAAITGYTQEEMAFYFIHHIPKLAQKEGLGNKALLDKIKFWYDGYSWDGINFVYAPFSISNLFKILEFNNYWFESGTLTFLVDVIENLKQGKLSFHSFESYQLLNVDTEKYDIGDIRLMPLLFQSGYLSVYEKYEGTIKVRFPNHEVRSSFMQYLFEQIADENIEQFDFLRKSICSCNIDKMMESIKRIMATIPYQILEKKENVYHSHFYTILKTINDNTQSEVSTNMGRIDTVMESADATFIFEFKMQSAREGIRQIKKNKYAKGYFHRNKKVFLIGVKFSNSARNIVDYTYELAIEKELIAWQNKEKACTDKIVIMYSHHDEQLKDQILVHVQTLKRHGIQLFDDITFDELEIKQTLSSAKIAIVLLSPHLLASNLLQSDVMTDLSKNHQKGTIAIFPMSIKPCAYKTLGWLENININDKPLSTLSCNEQDEIVAERVEQMSIFLAQALTHNSRPSDEST